MKSISTKLHHDKIYFDKPYHFRYRRSGLFPQDTLYMALAVDLRTPPLRGLLADRKLWHLGIGRQDQVCAVTRSNLLINVSRSQGHGFCNTAQKSVATTKGVGDPDEGRSKSIRKISQRIAKPQIKITTTHTARQRTVNGHLT